LSIVISISMVCIGYIYVQKCFICVALGCLCGDSYLKTKQVQEQQQQSTNRAQALAGDPEPVI
jgi:hypothetical protein